MTGKTGSSSTSLAATFHFMHFQFRDNLFSPGANDDFCSVHRALDDDRPGHQLHYRYWHLWFAWRTHTSARTSQPDRNGGVGHCHHHGMPRRSCLPILRTRRTLPLCPHRLRSIPWYAGWVVSPSGRCGWSGGLCCSVRELPYSFSALPAKCLATSIADCNSDRDPRSGELSWSPQRRQSQPPEQVKSLVGLYQNLENGDVLRVVV